MLVVPLKPVLEETYWESLSISAGGDGAGEGAKDDFVVVAVGGDDVRGEFALGVEGADGLEVFGHGEGHGGGGALECCRT